MALPLWVEFFEDLQHIRGRTQNTVMAYRRDLELYEAFAQQSQEILQFYAFMKRQGLSPRSQARVISSLRTYFRFCESQGLEVPPLTQLRPPKIQVGLPQALSVADFHKLMGACVIDDPLKSARNQTTLL